MISLIQATKENNFEAIEKHIEKKTNLDIQDDKGYTALMHASYNENIKVVQLLLENGANPNIYENKYSQNALLLSATKSDNKELIDLLAYYGSELSKLNHDALSVCFTNNHLNTAKCLLEKYYDVNSKKITAFMLWATQYGKNEVVKVILEGGFNVNQEYNQENFFEIALRQKHLEICKSFIEKGYDINFKKTVNTKSTFVKAICESSPEILEYLFSQGLFIPQKDLENKDSYIKLINHKDNFKLALDNGLKINELDIVNLVKSHATFAALACIKGVKVKPKIVDRIMRKLCSQNEFELIGDLIKRGYKLLDTIENKVPQEIKDIANSIQEKSQFEAMLNDDTINKRIKI
jgi:ankyrin repeat protein